MDNRDDKSLEEVEEQLKQQFNEIYLEPAEETLAAIRPRMKKKRKPIRFKSYAFMARFAAATASILLLFGIGLAVWLTWPDSDNPPEYRYEDLDIEAKPCEESDITSIQGLYLPDLDMLLSPTYRVGKHKESLETVYFAIEGYHSDGNIGRKIVLTIILQNKYEIKKEEQYNGDDKITVLDIDISYFEEDYIEPFYNYKVGFKKEDVRYYMDYQTTSSENDIQSFMEAFLI